MMMERTLSIIKPHAVEKNVIGEIFTRLERTGFKIIAMKMVHFSPEQAIEFYAEHKKRPFFKSLIQSITSGPSTIFILEKDNAIQDFRNYIGATNPENAASDTIRADYGNNITENAIHGSDSAISATREINYFFKNHEILPRLR
ncbi:Nucleoside diphosphate kinase [Candidatus Erwinia haradaeae]|uniref:Nucleoside diphosphate kinase n=1 Tax=Candidatus Erwinia haradaeae TaxID=1922217 RepID=A0A451DD76_9GAMM|nr:nucleoside-diphosphate kinase [Candidatus Erwinia haradaeae]VFP84425.1 Nucleoside diphosphate kinase [Candidatus Erwinia haradaeae]